MAKTKSDPGPFRASELKKMRGFKHAKGITSVMLMKKNPVRSAHEPFMGPFK